MAAVTPTKSLLLRSPNANKSNSLNTHLSLINFRKTHLGFQSNYHRKWTNLSFRVTRKTEYNQKQRGCGVRCTAEGIEKGLLRAGKGQEGNFSMPERFKVVALMACAMCLCNADRVVMSAAIVPLAAKHGWGSSFLGIVQSSFLWGYIFSSVVGGALVDRYGGKRVIAWGVALWSFATLLTPWAPNHSTTSHLAARAFFGLAEGVALPSMNILLSRWFPCNERATAVGMSMGGFHLGNVVGLVLTPLVISSIGLSGPLILFSALGLLWLTTWVYRVANDPQESRSITNSELRLIQAGKYSSPLNKDKLPPLRLLLSKMPTWAIIFDNVTNNWIIFSYFLLLSNLFLFSFFCEVSLEAGILCSSLVDACLFQNFPWGTMAISGCFAGASSDFVIKAGYSLTLVRKIMQSIGFVGPGLALLCLNYANTPVVASIYITAALSLSSFRQAGFLLNMQDIAPEYAGFLHGIANSAGTLAAIISTIGTGYFVQWLGSFQAFLTMTAGLYFVTAIFWNLNGTGERVF